MPTHQEGGSPIPPNVNPTAYDLISLEVDDILPSPLTPLVLHPTVPEPVCKMQTPALFTMAQASPQPQSVDTANYARVTPLPSAATSSSSSGELHLCIDSDASSLSVLIGLHSSSQEPLPQGNSQAPPPPSSLVAHTATPTTQHPPHSTNICWADEVEKSGTSTPETVIPNWVFSGRVRGPQPSSEPLVYPPPVMPTPQTHRPPVSSPRYGPTIPPLRSRQTLPNRPPMTDPHPRTIIRAQTPHPEDALGPQHRRSCLYDLHPCRLHNHLPDIKRALLEAHSPHHLVVEETHLLRHKASLTDLKDQISGSMNSPTVSA